MKLLADKGPDFVPDVSDPMYLKVVTTYLPSSIRHRVFIGGEETTKPTRVLYKNEQCRGVYDINI